MLIDISLLEGTLTSDFLINTVTWRGLSDNSWTTSNTFYVDIALFEGTLSSDFLMNTVTRRGSLKQIQ
jgi:hypothetical protein